MYFEINPRVINRQIKHLRSLGYDSIRIPGGKSKGKTKYSGIFAFVVDPNTKRKYLICTPYNSSFHLKEKEKDSVDFLDFNKDDENPKETAVREFWEETGILLSPERLDFIHKQFVLDNRIHWSQKIFHKKYFFSVTLDISILKHLKKESFFEKEETKGVILIPIKEISNFLYYRHLNVYNKRIINKTPIVF